MSAEITNVIADSPAWHHGVKAGDVLVSVNGHKISDVLDYMYYSSESMVTLALKRGDKHIILKFPKNEYDDLGLEFETFLMDKKLSCCNKCVFCFIDQMPPNMRKTLYFKDDDARLSFLQGNYVTLTNLVQKDIDRIIEMKLNINVSVHTTNPELRCLMMHNRFAGEKIAFLRQMADAGISMNCQIVLCPGLNDGDELRRTLTDLGSLMPNVNSVAIVPVGLTKFREGLYPLTLFNEKTAGEAIDIIECFQQEFLEKYGTRLVFPSDEFYLIAKRPLHDADFYEEYPQYENGVGMLSCFKDDFAYYSEEKKPNDSKVKISLVTGVAAAETIDGALKTLSDKYPGLDYTLYTIYNDYFGRTITVAGLVTATDIIAQLKGKNLGAYLIIPDVMLRDDTFLDDLTVSDVERELSVPVRVASDGAEGLLDAVEFCVKHSKKRG